MMGEGASIGVSSGISDLPDPRMNCGPDRAQPDPLGEKHLHLYRDQPLQREMILQEFDQYMSGGFY